MLAECPWCGNRFEAERFGRQRCPVCQAEIELPEPRSQPPAPVAERREVVSSSTDGWEQTSTYPPGWEEAPGLPGAPPPAVSEPAPWERMEEFGFLRAFWETWKGAALHPTRFFQKLGSYPSLWPSFLFAFLIVGLSSVFSTLWSELFGGSLDEALLPYFGLEPSPLPGGAIFWLVPSLISSAVGIWISVAIVHLGCIIFGAASKGFATTFRTVAFATAPYLLSALPGIGLISLIWGYAVLIVGIRWTQETTVGRAVLAVLFPFIVLGVLVLLALAAFAAFLSLV